MKLLQVLPVVVAGSLMGTMAQYNIFGSEEEADLGFIKLVIADFNKCDYGADPNNFYRSIYVSTTSEYAMPSRHGNPDISGNSYAAQWKKDDQYFGTRAQNTIYTVKCSKFNCKSYYGSWQRLELGWDIRNLQKDEILMLTGYGGLGQVYIPFLHTKETKLPNGKAYMLHLSPEGDNYALFDPMTTHRYNGVELRKNVPEASFVYSINMTHVFSTLEDKVSKGAADAITRTSLRYKPDGSYGNIVYRSSKSLSGFDLCTGKGSDSIAYNFPNVMKLARTVYKYGASLWPNY